MNVIDDNFTVFTLSKIMCSFAILITCCIQWEWLLLEMVWRHFEQCTYVIIIEVIHVTVAYHTSNYVEYVRQVLLTMKWRHFENMRARHNENIMSVFLRLCLNRRVCDAWCVSHTVRVPLMWLGGPDAGPVLVVEISGWTRNVCNKFQRH